MLEEKQRQFWNLHWIKHKTIDFQFSSYFFAGGRFSNITFCISKNILFWNFDLQKNNLGLKMENLDL